MKLAICICTHRRAKGLSRLLKALEPLALEHAFEIYVVDNHRAHEGLDAITALQGAGYPIPIHSAPVDEGGISQARNRVLQMAIDAQATHAALIDDDEWPSTQWLSELLRVQNIEDVDAVGGPTTAVFESDAPEALRNCIYYGADLNLEDNATCTLQACGNVLLKLQTLSELEKPFFDPTLGRSGGEDLRFFMRFEQTGFTMRWAKNAEVFETVPADRSTKQWLGRRVALIANTRVHIMSEAEPGCAAATKRCCKTLALGLQAMIYTALQSSGQSMQIQALIHRAKFRGKWRAHLGRRLERGENH